MWKAKAFREAVLRTSQGLGRALCRHGPSLPWWVQPPWPELGDLTVWILNPPLTSLGWGTPCTLSGIRSWRFSDKPWDSVDQPRACEAGGGGWRIQPWVEVGGSCLSPAPGCKILLSKYGLCSLYSLKVIRKNKKMSSQWVFPYAEKNGSTTYLVFSPHLWNNIKFWRNRNLNFGVFVTVFISCKTLLQNNFVSYCTSQISKRILELF